MRRVSLAAGGWLGLLFFAWVALARGEGLDPFLQRDQGKVIDAVTINGTAEVCSSAQVVWRRQYLSVQWQAASASGTANVRIYIKTSLDETNFVAPDGSADVTASDTSETWHLAAIQIPLSRQIQVCVVGNTGNPADTIATVWLVLQ